MHAVAAAAHGLASDRAWLWLEREDLQDQATAQEREFLHGRAADAKEAYREQVEAMWAMAWYLNLVPGFDLTAASPTTFAEAMPDLRKDSSAAWRGRARPKSRQELLDVFDTLECLVWAFDDTQSKGFPTPQLQRGLLARHRLRAIRWIAMGGEWVEPTAVNPKWW